MFAEQAYSYLIGVIVKTHQKKCEWTRYPISFPPKNSSVDFFVKNLELEYKSKINKGNSYFFSCSNGFIFFFTIKNQYHLCAQQDISMPVIELCCGGTYEKNLIILNDEINKYIESVEAQPDGFYNFLSQSLEGADFSLEDEIIAKLGIDNER